MGWARRLGRRKNNGRRPHAPLSSRERGAAVVEVALVAPVFMLMVFATIEYGFIFNNFNTLRQGTRDGARSASVNQLNNPGGSPYWCTTTGSPPSGADTNLICLIKNRVGLGDANTRVWISVPSPSGTAPNPVATGDEIVVCTQYLQNSITGLFAQWVNGSVLTSRVVLRAEQPSALSTGGETSVSQGSWTFCTG